MTSSIAHQQCFAPGEFDSSSVSTQQCTGKGGFPGHFPQTATSFVSDNTFGDNEKHLDLIRSFCSGSSRPQHFTFPRTIKPKIADFLYEEDEEEEEEEEKSKLERIDMSAHKKVDANAKTKPINKFHSNSLDKPELKATHSVVGSPATLSPDVQSHLSQYPRRGSDIVMGRGMKNRSRSVVIKLQVPSKISPGMSRRHVPGLESKSSPDVRERAMTYSGSPVPNRKYDKSPTPALAAEDSVELDDDKLDDGFSDISPLPGRLHSIKRNSFLYLSDTDENASKKNSRSSSIANNLFAPSEEVYITPFAQILANLQNVRNQFIILTNPPITEERRKKFNWTPHIPSGHLSEEEHKTLSLNVLDELDSCLHRLEAVNSAKSMGTMAQDKFRRILSRELSHLSERSKSGHFVAEWVNNLTGSSQDYEEIDRTLDTMSVVQTSQELSANLSSSKPKARSISVADEIPRFGIHIDSPNSQLSYNAIQKFMDTTLDEWGFDAFQLNFLTASQPLVALSYTVFSIRGLFSEFKISKQKFINFMRSIQSKYWSGNAYHNAIHAADVLHATNYLLRANALENVFTDLEIMASLVAAAVHDVDHPGKNNQFLINTSHTLAILYNDESVLENHHLAVAFNFLKDDTCNFVENLEAAQLKAFRRMVIDNVLATDMTKHLKHLGELKTKVETKKVASEGILHLDKFQDRSEVLQCLMHCADLSNPAKPPDIASTWAFNIMEESFLQGDEEKKLGIDIGPLGDRENVCVEKCQVSFIDYVIYPLWETWAELVYPDAQLILEHLAKTREYWSTRIVHSPLPDEVIQEDSKKNDLPISNNQSSLDVMSPNTEKEMLLTATPPASFRRDSYRTTRHMKEFDESVS